MRKGDRDGNPNTMPSTPSRAVETERRASFSTDYDEEDAAEVDIRECQRRVVLRRLVEGPGAP